jgi:hypothetical protein
MRRQQARAGRCLHQLRLLARFPAAHNQSTSGVKAYAATQSAGESGPLKGRCSFTMSGPWKNWVVSCRRLLNGTLIKRT